MQIHLHKTFFSDERFLDSYHKSFLNQTTLDLRKEKWTFLNWEFTGEEINCLKTLIVNDAVSTLKFLNWNSGRFKLPEILWYDKA